MKTRMRPVLIAVLMLVLSLAATVPASAASVGAQQQRGAQILSRLQHGKLAPKALSSQQYEYLGAYLMGRALGSTQLHQRMTSLMDEMKGPGVADQMHIYLGKRYLGVGVTPSRSLVPLFGLMGTMMSGYGYHGSSRLAGMMGRYLNGQGRSGYGMMGYGSGTQVANSSEGWPTAAIIAITVLAVLLIGGAAAFTIQKSGRGTHPGTPTTR
jgi:hypothetical protein